MPDELDEFDFLAELEKDFLEKGTKGDNEPEDEGKVPKFAVVSGAPMPSKRKRSREEAPPRERKKKKVDENKSKIKAKVRVVLLLQGVPGIGKTTILPLVEDKLKMKGIQCITVCKDNFRKGHSKAQAERAAKDAFEDLLEEEIYDVIILDSNHTQHHNFRDYVEIARKENYKVLVCFPSEVESDLILHLIPVVLQSAEKRRGHPNFDHHSIDKKYHLTLMHINSLKPARKTQVDGVFSLKWLHPKKCVPMKSDRTQFLNAILNHTRRVGWEGAPVDAKMIQQRLNFNFDYTVWRRSQEACASSAVTGVLNFIKEHFPEIYVLYNPPKTSTLPPYPPPPPQHNTTQMSLSHLTPLTHTLTPLTHAPPPRPPLMMGQPPRNTISQTFTPVSSFPPPPPGGLQLHRPPPPFGGGFPSNPPPPMRMPQSFPPARGMGLQQHPPPPPMGSNNRYTAFPPQRNPQQDRPNSYPPPPQRERGTRNSRFDRHH